MSLASMLESVGTLKRPRINQDAAKGTTTDTYTTVAADVPCSVQDAPPKVQMRYSQQNIDITSIVYMDQWIDAQPEDTFEVRDINNRLHTYNVQGISEPVNQGRLWQMPLIEEGAQR